MIFYIYSVLTSLSQETEVLMSKSKNLTVAQVAEILEIQPRTVRLYIARGHFPSAYKLDPTRKKSEYRIPQEDVTNFLAKQGRKSPESLQ